MSRRAGSSHEQRSLNGERESRRCDELVHRAPLDVPWFMHDDGTIFEDQGHRGRRRFRQTGKLRRIQFVPGVLMNRLRTRKNRLACADRFTARGSRLQFERFPGQLSLTVPGLTAATGTGKALRSMVLQATTPSQ